MAELVTNGSFNFQTDWSTTGGWVLSGTQGVGLVAHWKFDDGSGTSAADASGNGNTATLINTPTWGTGKINDGLGFDKTSEEYATTPISISGGDVTVLCWVKSNTINDQGFVASFNVSDGDNRLLMGHQPDVTTLQIFDSGFTDSGQIAFDGTFHHIGYTLSGGTTITPYVDGVAGTPFATTTTIVSSDLFTIGQEYDPGLVDSDWFDGDIDEVRVYDSVLSTGDIQDIFNSTAVNDSNAAVFDQVNGNGVLVQTISITSGETYTVSLSVTNAVGVAGTFKVVLGGTSSSAISGSIGAFSEDIVAGGANSVIFVDPSLISAGTIVIDNISVQSAASTPFGRGRSLDTPLRRGRYTF